MISPIQIKYFEKLTLNSVSYVQLPGLILPANYQICIFLLGIETSSSLSYDIRITNSTDLVNNKIGVSLEYEDFSISHISLCVVLINIGDLEISYWVFAQIGTISSNQGIQQTFFSPQKVCHQQNYISGLLSFSIKSNNIYNMTISSLNFTTLPNSKYNDISYLNIWARKCSSPFNQFNKNDQMCYKTCPSHAYQISVSELLCGNCNQNCGECFGGEFDECISCLNNKTLINNQCVCQDNYYQDNHLCKQCHYTCKQCGNSGQYFHCTSCDSNLNRVQLTSPSGQCLCSEGYFDNGWQPLCRQICGDGKKISSQIQCDDNNTNNFDGCSSSCLIQDYFECETDNAGLSHCHFVGIIEIEVVRLEKTLTSNEVKLFLKLTPFVEAFKSLTSQYIFTNISGKLGNVASEANHLISCKIDYLSNMQGNHFYIGIKPFGVGLFSDFKPQNTSFVAKSSNAMLINTFEQFEYQKASQIGSISQIQGLVYLILAFLFFHNEFQQMGLELIFTIQFMFISFSALPLLDPYSAQMLNVKKIMGWNYSGGTSQTFYSSVPVTAHMGFSAAFTENVNFMLVFPAIALVLYMVYRILKYKNTKQNNLLGQQYAKNFQLTTAGKVTKYFKFTLFTFFMLFNMQQILFATLTQIQFISNPLDIVVMIISLIGVAVCVIGLFIFSQSFPTYRILHFHQFYGGNTFLLVLAGTILNDVILLLSVLVNRYIFCMCLLYPTVALLYIIFQRPFRKFYQNIRLAILEICLIAQISLIIHQIVKINNNEISLSLNFFIGIMICIGIPVTVSIFIWVLMNILKIKELLMTNNSDYVSEKHQSEKEQQSINQKVREAGFALVSGLKTARSQVGQEMGSLYPVFQNNQRSRFGISTKQQFPDSPRKNKAPLLNNGPQKRTEIEKDKSKTARNKFKDYEYWQMLNC